MKYILILALSLIVLISCKKGSVGPEGPVGLAGPAGVMGNANIRQYSFPLRKITTGTFDDTLTNISKGFIDSSLVLTYFSVSSVWYPVPGLGVSAKYNTQYILFQDNPSPSRYIMRFFIYQANSTSLYTSPITWDKVKVIVAPASKLTVMRKLVSGKLTLATPDFSRYVDVCKFFTLKP